MFHSSKKKKEPIINPVFGEVKDTGGYWEKVEKIPIELFGRTYLTNVSVHVNEISKDEYEPINKQQEEAFKKTLEILKNKKEEIERVVTLEFKSADQDEMYYSSYKPYYNVSDIPSRFEVESLEISRDSYSTIYVSDNAQIDYLSDESHEGFALSLLPEIGTHPKIDYFGWIF